MNRYEKALQDLKDMIYVGGTLADADYIIDVFEDLINNYEELKESYTRVYKTRMERHKERREQCKTTY